MNSRKTITLCSSASMYQKLIGIEKDLLKLGFQVEVPISARKMEESGDFSMKGKKTWMEDPSQFYKKTELMDTHFKKVVDGDAVLIVNLDKNGVKGYIGGNVLMGDDLSLLSEKTDLCLEKYRKRASFLRRDFRNQGNVFK